MVAGATVVGGGGGGGLGSSVLRDLKRWITLCDGGPLNWFCLHKIKFSVLTTFVIKLSGRTILLPNTRCFNGPS